MKEFLKNNLIKIVSVITAFLFAALALGHWGVFLIVMLSGCALAIMNGIFSKSTVAKIAFTMTMLCLLYTVLIFPLVNEYMSAHWPGFWSTFQEQRIAADYKYAKIHAVAGNGMDAVDLRNAIQLEDRDTRWYDSATTKLMQKPEWLYDDSILFRNLKLIANKKKQEVQNLKQGGVMYVTDAPGSSISAQTSDNYPFMVVDVKNPEGATFEIPAGVTAEVSIDSAWYSCNFRELLGYRATYIDGNGYGIIPRTARGGGREYVNRFLNPDESMGAVLAFDERNPQGYRFAMGQTISVKGSFVKIAVNDWVGGWFGGEGGTFAASKEFRRGGFYDNRGFLRVLIVLKP